jgi:membrane-bound lytic murein transglycosylase D
MSPFRSRPILLAASALLFVASAVAQTDAPVSLERAQALAASSPSNSGFSIVVNDEVLAQLNRYLTQPGSKKSLKLALQRMEKMKEMLQKNTHALETPWELLAIPLVESKFRNPPETANPWRSAGLWQFVRSSARANGLKVDAKKDERLDPDKSTYAALNYLKKLHADFGSWPLAILAYNSGPTKVRKALAAGTTTDGFELLKNGMKAGDPDYLAKIMASALILTNPTLLD